ncbi:hypothetical protein OK024_01325 [Acinetobacter sp. UGAL515B_02]|nr:hypothetical protein [Acinetobacter sp. UGAL515B_02]WON80515.1 hypothetical protein OK024_01325 [Acinetobacter sp. UGAL515B_02]
MNIEKEVAVIPKGTKIQIMGCSYILLKDVKVDGMQIYLDQILKAQKEFENGIGTTKDCL